MSRCFIIAEAGVNHNGDLDLAHGLVDSAVEAGADAVKFQTFRPEKLASKQAGKAEYQKRSTDPAEPQIEMLRRLALSEADHRSIAAHCRERGIEFLSSVFDIESAGLLARQFGLRRLKLGSGELTNAPLLLFVARLGSDVILSTGMADLDEIEGALSVLAYGYVVDEGYPDDDDLGRILASDDGRQRLRRKVTLLQCTTEYPAPYDEVNLRAMDTMKDHFGLRVGYSDHTSGIEIALAAAALGAAVVEKHFTLDRTLPGPDHKASLEPTELRALCEGVRKVEQALGDGVKMPTVSELPNRAVARKSIVAATAISAGEIFTVENLTTKRPGTGISPMRYWSFLGRRAGRDYRPDEEIEP